MSTPVTKDNATLSLTTSKGKDCKLGGGFPPVNKAITTETLSRLPSVIARLQSISHVMRAPAGVYPDFFKDVHAIRAYKQDVLTSVEECKGDPPETYLVTTRIC